MLNLTHRRGHVVPQPLEPGRPVDVTLRLDAAGWSMPAGHRFRIAIAPSYWPTIWPAPELVTLTIHTGPDCALRLPLRPPRPEDSMLAAFGPAEGTPRIARDVLRPAARHRRLVVDQATRRQTLESGADSGRIRWHWLDLETERVGTETHSIVEGDPLSAEVRCHRRFELVRDDWRVRGEAESVMTCDAERFYVTTLVRAWEDDALVHERERRFVVARHLV
jgi:hypothetical protein